MRAKGGARAERVDPGPLDESLQRLAERYGTPTYVYDLNVVSAQVARLRSAFPDAELFYAVKANPCGAVLRHLSGLGVGVEVISEGELARALRAGFSPERVLLGGPRQDAPLIAAARGAGIGWVSLDSPSQLLLWRAQNPADAPMRFLLRLNPGLNPRTHEHLATGAATSKFGMPFAEVVRLAEALGERLAGVHVHIGSQILDLSDYDEVFVQLRALLERFPHVSALNLGGGFAVPGFPLEAFAERLRAVVAGRQLLLEPGRFLIAESGVLLTKVLHVKGDDKTSPMRHVITDAGMAELLRPALYGARHPIRVVGRTHEVAEVADKKLPRLADIDGPLCENADRLARGVSFPEVAPGNLLVVEQAGAYGFAMASNYASSLRPAEVVLEGGKARLARRRETPDDLLRLEE